MAAYLEPGGTTGHGTTVGPLSYVQERLWFIDAAAPGGSSYHVPVVLRWVRPADPCAMRAAVRAVVEHHDVLRTTYQVREGRPLQRVGPADGVGLVVRDSAEPPSSAELARWGSQPFDLSDRPPVRFVLWRVAHGDDVLLITVHHIAVDGWSLATLLADLADAYRAAVEGTPACLAELPMRYGDYARWERDAVDALVREGRVEARARELAPAAADLALAGRRGPVTVSEGDRPGGQHRFDIPSPLWAGIEELAGRTRATPFVVVLAAYQELLRRWSGLDEFLVATVMANRPRPEFERMIGFFANTVPLVCRPRPGRSFESHCAEVRIEAFRALNHQRIPLHLLASRVAAHRSQGRGHLAQVGFALQNAPAPARSSGGLWREPELLFPGTTKFDLMLLVEPAGPAATGTVEFDLDRYPPEAAAALAEQFLVLLRSAVARPEQRLSRLPLTGRTARGVAPGTLRGPCGLAETPPDTILDAVAARLAREPDRPAVTCGSTGMSRRELDRLAWRVCDRLLAHGVGPGDRVPVLAVRGGGLVAAWLGVLRAGAAYVPVDLDAPAARLGPLAERVKARVAVVDDVGQQLLGRAGVGIATLHLTGTSLGHRRVRRPTVTATTPAVVFPTSGTTGEPKYVVVPHRGVANTVTWWARDAALRPGDRVLCVVGSAFDPATFTALTALAGGAELVLVDDLERRDGVAVARLLGQAQVGVMTPSILREATAGDPPRPAGSRPRLLYIGGEPLSRSLATTVYRRWRVPLRNLYGPTEASCNATAATVDHDDDDGDPPIGRPIANTRVYLLGSDQEEIPVGAPGEIYLAGAGVAAGYLDDPAATAAAFLPDPYAPTGQGGGVMYRSGDLGMIGRDGQLRFLGRVDDQVKVLGNRVELGEVRRLIERHPAVRAAAVEVVGDPSRLLAHVELSPGAPVPEWEEMIRPLRQRLPAAAVPSDIDVVPRLPLNANDKLDPAALRRLPRTPLRRQAGSADPLSPDQVWAAALFRATLGLGADALGPDSDFFRLGGHSLLAVRLLDAAQRDGAGHLPLRDFLAEPTVARLARARTVAAPRTGDPAAHSADGRYPATATQQSFLFLDRVASLRDAYLAPTLVELRGAVDRGRLRQAVQTVLGRHPALRSRFGVDLEARRVFYRTDGPPPPVLECDLGGIPDNQLADRVAAACREPFDLRTDAPARAHLLHTAQRTVVVMVAHHIAVDGWSRDLLLDQIAVAYRAAATGARLSLSPAGHPAAVPDAWAGMSQEDQETAVARVLDRLDGAPRDVWLPRSRRRGTTQSTRGGLVSRTVCPATTAQLRRVLSAAGCSTLMAAAALLAVVLARRGGQRDLLMVYPWAGRDAAASAHAVGMLVNTVPLRIDLRDSPTWRVLLERVRGECLASYRSAHVPFDVVSRRLDPDRDLGRPRLTPVLLNPVSPPAALDLGPEVAASFLPVPEPHVKYELELIVAETPERLELTVAYATALFDPEPMRRLAADLVTAARELADAPERTTMEARS